ncbi:MAG: hypothetical protein PHW52_00555 [Candidatus Pacebacteria bacterium]|nr:hypothetical protein [Candidatus Paceibacterota bacterium]
MNKNYIPSEIMNIIDIYSQKYNIDKEIESGVDIRGKLSEETDLETRRTTKYFSQKVQEGLQGGRNIEEIIPSYLVKKTLIAVKNHQIEYQDAYFFLERKLDISKEDMKNFFDELFKNETIMKYLIGQYYDDVDYEGTEIGETPITEEIPENITPKPEEKKEESKNFLKQELL